VADTYRRPVIEYVYIENYLTSTGEKKVQYQSEIFFPLIEMEDNDADRPISLLAFSHFYYVEFGRTPKGKMKVIKKKPTLNMDHDRIRRQFPIYVAKPITN
jgi:hypothetical protein